MDRKRKIRDYDESPSNIMSLLKRLHLDRSSELYEKCPLTERKVPGCKRWRLSPIHEQGENEVSSHGVKRRRIDSEMAEQMTHSLWITEAKEREIAHRLDVRSKLDGGLPHSGSPVETPKRPCLDNLRRVQLNVVPPQSIEDHVIQRHMQEQNMQLVLWTPPPVDMSAIINTCDGQDNSVRFCNELEENDYMC